MNLDFTPDFEGKGNILPAGWYEATIKSASFKQAKSGIDYLNIQFETSGGQFIWAMYNIFNKNDVARNIAMRDLKSILVSQGTDVSKLKDVSRDQLLDLITSGPGLLILLTSKTDDFGTKNQVVKYDKSQVKSNAEIPF